MKNTFIIRTLLLWIVFVPLAIINGAIRNFVYKPYVGDLLAHQISTITGVLAFYVVAYLAYRKLITKVTAKDAWSAGVLLVFMTVLFEFGFGHYIAGNSWAKLLADYNLFAGRVWGLFLLSTLFAPYLVRKYLLKARTK